MIAYVCGEGRGEMYLDVSISVRGRRGRLLPMAGDTDTYIDTGTGTGTGTDRNGDGDADTQTQTQRDGHTSVSARRASKP